MPHQSHAILGAGGVGGFVGTLLAAAGDKVIVLARRERVAGYPGSLTLESSFGNRRGRCTVTDQLSEEVDILWVAPKATQLQESLHAVPEPRLASSVVPLLNGVDHVAILRERFGHDAVLPGTIAAELERTAPGHFVQRSPFARFGFITRAEPVLRGCVEIFTGFGASCAFEVDETTLLWRKLALLAPMALTTTAYARSIGEIRDDPALEEQLEAAIREAGAVAVAEGAQVDVEQTLGFLRGAPAGLRSSMQKDVEGGRPPELDGIGGPILRGARRHGLAAPVTAALMERIQPGASRLDR